MDHAFTSEFIKYASARNRHEGDSVDQLKQDCGTIESYVFGARCSLHLGDLYAMLHTTRHTSEYDVEPGLEQDH